MKRLLTGLVVCGLLLSGCASPSDELRAEVVRTRAAAESAAESGNAEVLRSQLTTLVALIARQRADGDLSPERATALTQLAQQLADDAALLERVPSPTPTSAPTTRAPEPDPTSASPSPSPSPTAPDPVEVPDLVGLPAGEADATLRERELKGAAFGCDTEEAVVTAQEPPARTEVPPGSTVSYACEEEDETEPDDGETVKVPDVRGQQFGQAVQTLAGAGLVAVDDGTCVDPALPVLTQDPGRNERVARESEVVLGCA